MTLTAHNAVRELIRTTDMPRARGNAAAMDDGIIFQNSYARMHEPISAIMKW
jgi:hypothetical protein